MINDVAYPAGPEFVAVYVVSEFDGSTLDIECRYNSSTSTASWELVRSDYDGFGVNTGPAPVEPVTLVIDAPGALTEWVANGTTLSFFQISPQLEGLYRCTAAGVNLRILLTGGMANAQNYTLLLHIRLSFESRNLLLVTQCHKKNRL